MVAVSFKTRAQLAARALEKLLVVGSGQSADSEDIEKVDDAIDAVLADLEARNIASVSDLSQIDLAPFEWLAMILADSVATDFGQEQNPQKRAYAESMLRRIGAPSPTYETMVGEYF
jgi:hypothetical protein